MHISLLRRPLLLRSDAHQGKGSGMIGWNRLFSVPRRQSPIGPRRGNQQWPLSIHRHARRGSPTDDNKHQVNSDVSLRRHGVDQRASKISAAHCSVFIPSRRQLIWPITESSYSLSAGPRWSDRRTISHALRPRRTVVSRDAPFRQLTILRTLLPSTHAIQLPASV